MALVVNNPPAGAGDAGVAGSIPGSGRSPGGGDSNLLQHFAWKTPWTEEPDGLQSRRLQIIRHNWACIHTCNTEMVVWSTTSTIRLSTLYFLRWYVSNKTIMSWMKFKQHKQRKKKRTREREAEREGKRKKRGQPGGKERGREGKKGEREKWKFNL